MRRPGFIIAAAAGVSLLQTVLMLAILIPRPGFPTPSWLAGELLIPLATIVAIAILVSILVHGPEQWLARALWIVAAPAIPFLLILVSALVSAGIDWALGHPPDRSLGAAIGLVVLVILLWGVGSSVGFGWSRSRRTSVELDEEEWLAARRSGVTPTAYRNRSRAIRLAVCLPALMVLLVAAFLPECWGIATHVRYSTTARVGSHQVPIPVTWITMSDDEFGVQGFVGSGLAGDPHYFFGFSRLLPFGAVNLSGWSFSNHGARVHSAEREPAIDSRVLTVADMRLTCTTWQANTYWEPFFGKRVLIECTAPSGFAANFFGSPRHVAGFYGVVGRVH